MIAEAINAYARATARVFEDRGNFVGASEVGQCARKVYFSKNEGDWLLGAARDTDHVDRWGAARRGTILEDHLWVPALRLRFGDRLKFAGERQESFASGHLRATIDGLITGLPRDALENLGVADIGSGDLVVECKSIDPRVRLDEPKPEHFFQAQVQIGMIREATAYRPQYALVSYVNASFVDDVVEFPIAFDPMIFAAAKARAAEIMTARTPEALKPEGWIAGGAECEYCAFTGACGRMRHALPRDLQTREPDPQFVAEITDLARASKRQRGEVEAAARALRETEYEIRERLRGRGLRRITGLGVTVTWSAVKGRPSYDWPAIRQAAEQAGLDISSFVTVGDPTDRLTITIRDAASAVA